MLTAAKIVETVPWIDAKYYAATQTMDEARHTEVFARYLRTKVGEAYPMGPVLEAQITALLEDSRWDIAYLGMQIVIESLALAAFGDMLRRTEEPLLHKLLRYVLADEARHVAFGIVTLGEYYRTCRRPSSRSARTSCSRTPSAAGPRALNGDVWERMGTTLDAVWPSIKEARAATAHQPDRLVRAGLLRQAGAQRPQARAARRQRRLPAPALGRGRAAAVRVRRRHGVGLRGLRRRGPGPGRRAAPTTGPPEGSGQRRGEGVDELALGADLGAGHRAVGGDEREGVVAAEAVEHEQAHGHRAGPADTGPAVDEQVLAAVEALARPGRGTGGCSLSAGAWRSGIGNHIARPPSCSCSQAT